MKTPISKIPTAAERRSTKTRRNGPERRPRQTPTGGARFTGNGPYTDGSQFTAEETEFLMAIEKYKRERRRAHPKWSEVLEVLRSLGWRKVPEREDQ
jgi:hypothetical protein